MADDNQNETIAGAHTPGSVQPEPEKIAKLGDQKAVAEAAISDLASQFDPTESPSQSSLFEDEACLFSGPVKHVAEQFERPKGPGRPKGSKNKANQLFRDYVLAKGYRHPGLNLADLANANPHDLAAELSQPYRAKSGQHKGELVEVSCTPAEAMELIRKANVELMPYFESKRPTEVEVKEQGLHYLVIDNSGATQQAAEEGVLSITGTVQKIDGKSDT